MPTASPHRSRGRPVGGGNTAEQAKAVLLDAAERSILRRGYQASTMGVIAQDAGYSRAAMYQQFPNRQSLLEALVRRVTARHQEQILARLPSDLSLADLLVESLMIVATELIHDPLLKMLSEQTGEGTVGHLIATDPGLPQLVEAMIHGWQAEVRPGLRPGDVGQYIVSTALAMLLGVIPAGDDPETARRYLRTFFLPAVLLAPPDPGPVFDRRSSTDGAV